MSEIMKKSGFIYLWFDKARKMYYLGCHWGTEYDGYICSSNRMRNARKNRPQDFRRRIIQRNITDRKQLLSEEHKWLSLIEDDELGRKYYNHSKKHFGHWANNPKTLVSVGQRMSQVNKGRKHNLTEEERRERGRLISESKKRFREQKESVGLSIYNKTENWRPANLGKIQSSESNEKRANAMKDAWYTGKNKGTTGKTLRKRTEEEIRHMSKTLSGKVRTDEQKQNMSEANKKAWSEGKWSNRKSNNMKDYIWVHSKETGKNTRILKDRFDPGIYILGRRS